MRWPVHPAVSKVWRLCAVPLFFLAVTPGVEGAPQAASNVPSSDTLQALEQRIDHLTSALNALSAEVKRSHQETQELREELDAARAQLAVLAKAEQPGKLPAGSGTVSAGDPKPDAQTEDPQVTAGLNKVEESQELLQAKVNDQYQTKVESASKYRVKLSGIALLNIFGNHGAVDTVDLPNIARARGPLDSTGSVGATVRQSMLGLEVFGPELEGAKTRGELQADFFGGFPGTVNGTTTGLVRLRTAKMSIVWNRTSIVAGQDALFFSPLSPTSLASLADPALSYSGNLWTWTPQVRVEHRVPVTEGSDLVVTAGVLDSLTGELPVGLYYRQPQAGERSGQPAYAARIAWSARAWKQPLSFGAGSYYARQDWGRGRKVDAWAATAAWQVPLGRLFGFSGEFYRGRALGGLGAAEGRSVLFSGPLALTSPSVRGLNTAGGWTQLKFSPTEKLEFNTAFGEDVPYASDFSRFTVSTSYVASQVSRNQSGFVNVIYHLRSNLLLSAEYRKLWTSERYETQNQADIINLSVGVLF